MQFQNFDNSYHVLTFLSRFHFQPLPAFRQDERANVKVDVTFQECASQRTISCVKDIHIQAWSHEVTVTRRQSGTSPIGVKVNGEVKDILKSPYSSARVYIKQATSQFVVVKAFGFRIYYDGENRLYLDFDPFFEGKVRQQLGINVLYVY